MKKITHLPSILFFLLLFSTYSVCYAQLSKPLPFMTEFIPKSTRILEYKDIATKNIPSALVRLPNRKLAYMVRQNSKLKPFYINAIETGWWDGLNKKSTNLDSVFNDMKVMGANTAFVMVHWEHVEPRDNNFDFSFTDKIVAAAGRQKIKVYWVFFLHAQADGVPSYQADTAWTFHLDDRNGSNYTMQWPTTKGTTYTNIKDVLKKSVKAVHVYGHPEVFYRIRRVLYNLAVRYKKSETVIGIQIGNEEGFSFWDESDANSVMAKLFDEWKLKTNKDDYAQFKKDAINWWWGQFASAYHEGDPYKLTSTNLHAGIAENPDSLRAIKQSGTSASTYADGNLDAIGTMFYKPWGYPALLGLDRRYGNTYNYQLPILLPSEIGIGSRVDFQEFVLNSLERGAQGFGVFSYGKIKKESPNKKNRNDYVNMVKMINSNEKIIYGGLPGPGMTTISTANNEARVSHLNTNKQETLAMIYFPTGKVKPDNSTNFTLKINLEGASNNYKIHIQQNGKEIYKQDLSISAGIKTEILLMQDVKRDDVFFVSVVPLSQ
jgi:hypothetical protein